MRLEDKCGGEPLYEVEAGRSEREAKIAKKTEQVKERSGGGREVVGVEGREKGR